jgi:hypothetical protein
VRLVAPRSDYCGRAGEAPRESRFWRRDDGMGVNETVADMFRIAALVYRDWAFVTHATSRHGRLIGARRSKESSR